MGVEIHFIDTKWNDVEFNEQVRPSLLMFIATMLPFICSLVHLFNSEIAKNVRNETILHKIHIRTKNGQSIKLLYIKAFLFQICNKQFVFTLWTVRAISQYSLRFIGFNWYVWWNRCWPALIWNFNLQFLTWKLKWIWWMVFDSGRFSGWKSGCRQ